MSEEPSYILSWLFTRSVPFIAFGSGVCISVYLELNGNVRGKHVFLMSVPVSLLTVGNTLAISDYNYMNSLPNFSIFLGTMILYGTLVPQLFDQIRGRIREE